MGVSVRGERTFGSLCALGVLALCAGASVAAPPAADPTNSAPSSGISPNATPFYRIPMSPVVATDHASGKKTLLPRERVWKPICGTPTGSLTSDDLKTMDLTHEAAFSDPTQVIVVDESHNRAGLDLVFVLGSGVPSASLPAFATAEAYLEGQFPNDAITVTINVSFANLGSGVLGGTSSTFGYVTYAGSRSGLVAGMDASDTIQSSLPTTSTIPVRYSSSSTTNEDRVFWTIANYNAAIGAAAGTAATMQFSNTFPWDYDPSNGVTGTAYSFQDVIIHEVGHALGFTSGIDFRNRDIDAPDMFRFQRTDGSGDYNPDTTAEFTARARLARYNAPNDDHNFDNIAVEYRLSDGSPYQASHFREQTANIGLMDPALGYGQTFYPNFFSAADRTVFDAVGWDL